jgi:hypothetical protein
VLVNVLLRSRDLIIRHQSNGHSQNMIRYCHRES